MNPNDTIKQYAVRFSGSDIIPGIHHLNVFGVISRIPADDPSIRRFKNREEAQNWMENYKARPYCVLLQ